MGKGKGRLWGYASYDVDDEDSEEYIYTSYEKSGAVNKYKDNGDGDIHMNFGQVHLIITMVKIQTNVD